MRSPSRSSQSLLPKDARKLSRRTSYTLPNEDEVVHQVERGPTQSGVRVHLVRTVALLCACSLSLGSHYASYILGPLKSRLTREMGTSNTEFSLLIAAFSLSSTWTPLVGGVLAGRLGTTYTSIIATGLVFVGQLLLLLGDSAESIRLMTLGMFVFGLGVSPLAVVQESIIVRFFKDHGLGVSMAFGLVFGKASSFVAARTSYPLSEALGPRAPFIVASSLAGLSFCMNLVYLSASRWLVTSTGTELEASEIRQEASHRRVESISEVQALKQVARKRTVRLRDIVKLGDVFWAYIGLNVLCGAIWSPFTHLAANLFEKRYDLTERQASNYASYLLAFSVFLYPIIGFTIDRLKGKRPIVQQLFLLSSTLTGLCYVWLSLPPSLTKTPLPSIVSYGLGQGFAPLLLVIIVPNIISTKYIPTTLGAHKALEHSGQTIFQTFAGLLLDKYKNEDATTKEAAAGQKRAISQLLYIFLFLNVCHFFAILGLWHLDTRRKAQLAEIEERLREQGLEDDIEHEPPIEPELLNGHGAGERYGSRANRKERERASESHSLRARDSPISSPANPFKMDLPKATSSGPRGDEAETIAEERNEEERPLLDDTEIDSARNSRILESQEQVERPVAGEAVTKAEHIRGETFGVISIGVIAFAWVFFITTAFLRLRAKKDREGSS